MRLIFHTTFKKSYKTRIKNNPSLKRRFFERIKLFLKEPTNPILKDHPLKGDLKGYRSFSITGDVRVIYKKEEHKIIFIDVGTHTQVYRK